MNGVIVTYLLHKGFTLNS